MGQSSRGREGGVIVDDEEEIDVEDVPTESLILSPDSVIVSPPQPIPDPEPSALRRPSILRRGMTTVGLARRSSLHGRSRSDVMEEDDVGGVRSGVGSRRPRAPSTRLKSSETRSVVRQRSKEMAYENDDKFVWSPPDLSPISVGEKDFNDHETVVSSEADLVEPARVELESRSARPLIHISHLPLERIERPYSARSRPQSARVSSRPKEASSRRTKKRLPSSKDSMSMPMRKSSVRPSTARPRSGRSTSQKLIHSASMVYGSTTSSRGNFSSRTSRRANTSGGSMRIQKQKMTSSYHGPMPRMRKSSHAQKDPGLYASSSGSTERSSENFTHTYDKSRAHNFGVATMPARLDEKADAFRESFLTSKTPNGSRIESLIELPSEEELALTLPPEAIHDELERKMEDSKDGKFDVEDCIEFLVATRLHFGSNTSQEVEALLRLAKAYLQSSLPQQCISHCRTARRKCEQLPPIQKRALLPLILTATAAGHILLKNNEIALTLLRRALSMNEEVHGASNISSVPILMALGKVFVSMEEYTQAEVHLVKALAIEQSVGMDDRMQIEIHLELSHVSLLCGAVEDAIDNLRQTSELLLRVEGTSLQYAETEVQLARLLSSRGKHEEAVDHAQKGFHTHRMVCGEEDERTSNAGMFFVSKLLAVDDYDSARDVLKDIVMMQKNLYGARDVVTADSMKLLASVHLKLGDVESAIHAFSIVSKIYEDCFGPADHRYLSIRSHLESLLKRQAVGEEERRVESDLTTSFHSTHGAFSPVASKTSV
eukprot:TRINITY_DN979_c0_g1_i3.p1 TRINITY_DN979_c0_g1~~TRINITY_DN979_c0_g1_i3.p1  ORF type:complete len:835 (+),score=215.85 TRINITY_DN979_c0_g1_i3:185-2506(+)